jgi:DNA-binding XRE family transcriptional regulator
MKNDKRRTLESAGWRVGDAEEFLGLTRDEVVLLQMREALGRRVRELRDRDGVTQVTLAARMGSSQSRVAKIEAGHPGVSLDLMVRALLALGADSADVGECISSPA